MRNFKRFLAMALSLLMIVGCFSMLASAKFEDVAEYQDEIEILNAMGIIKGYEDGNFHPDDDITRRQACILFARILTGRTDAEYEETNFKGGKNYTVFTDLDETGDFYGAISLAYNEGIIVGWEEEGKLVFGPNSSISYQDFLTMAVRIVNNVKAEANTALDKTYPWSYINAAIRLGLTEGIVGVPANEEPISRGDATKIMFNLLFKVQVNGEFLAKKFFGKTYEKATMILTAAKGNVSLIGITLPARDNYVTINYLKNDGTIDLDKTYFVPAESLGLTAANASKYVGSVYEVVTIDGFKSIFSANRIEWTEYLDWNGKLPAVKDGEAVSHDYRIVKKYSTIFNTGSTWTTLPETFLYDLTKVDTNNGSFDNNYGWILDNDFNILAQGSNGGEHQILFYYMPELSVAYGGAVYFQKMTDGSYKSVTIEEIQEALKATVSESGYRYYKAVDKLTDSLYKDVYTLDIDGAVDAEGYEYAERIAFANYQVGKYLGTVGGDGADKNKHKFSIGYFGEDSGIKATNVVLADGVQLSTGAHHLYRYYYNVVLDTVVVAYDYVGDWEVGYISNYVPDAENPSDYSKAKLYVKSDADNDSWWWATNPAGTALSFIIGNYYGANTIGMICERNNEMYLEYADLVMGQRIEYVKDAKADKVIAIEFNSSNSYYIFDKFIAIDDAGYVYMRVMNNNGKYEIIKANTVDSYPYYSFAGLGYLGLYNDISDITSYNFDRILKAGDVVKTYNDGSRYNVISTRYFKPKFETTTGEARIKIGSDWYAYDVQTREVGDKKNDLPKYIITNEYNDGYGLGLFVLDLTSAKTGAIIDFYRGYEYTTQLGNDTWYFQNFNGNAADDAYAYVLDSYFANGDKVTGVTSVDAAWPGQNTINLYDVVYFDGSVRGQGTVISNLGTSLVRANLYKYSDPKGKLVGFTSMMKDNLASDKSIGYDIYSYNQILDPGFYTVIQMQNGMKFIGRCITSAYADGDAEADWGMFGKAENVRYNSSSMLLVEIGSDFKLHTVQLDPVNNYTFDGMVYWATEDDYGWLDNFTKRICIVEWLYTNKL